LPPTANKSPALEQYLTREEFRARFDAEKVKAQRHYCTLFGFWRTCRFKPCRRERACMGDAPACLTRSVGRISRPQQFDAREKLLQATPANMAAPERAARAIMPGVFDDPSERVRPQDIPRGWTRKSERRRGAKR
jgi:hypothetical protein